MKERGHREKEADPAALSKAKADSHHLRKVTRNGFTLSDVRSLR